MPLRNHFPTGRRATWQPVHGGWPMTIVQNLFDKLPKRFQAEPHIRRGSGFELDVAGFDRDPLAPSDGGSVATAVRPFKLKSPATDLKVEFVDQDEYEVLIYDDEFDRRLVAAIEFVSPANKDRPENRKTFVAKCHGLLKQKVCVGIVDLVSTKRFNLCREILEDFGGTEEELKVAPIPIYTAMLRSRIGRKQSRIQAWHFPLKVGKPIPPLPLELSETEAIEVDLEGTYEETCKYLRID